MKNKSKETIRETRKPLIPCSSVHESKFYALKHGGKKGRNARKAELRKEMEV